MRGKTIIIIFFQVIVLVSILSLWFILAYFVFDLVDESTTSVASENVEDVVAALSN